MKFPFGFLAIAQLESFSPYFLRQTDFVEFFKESCACRSLLIVYFCPMIIPKSDKLTPEQLAEVEEIAGEFDCSILEIVGQNRCIYAILGDEGRELMFNR